MIRFLLPTALVMASAFASAQNLIVNGGFEDPVQTSAYSAYAVGSSDVTGWTIIGSAGQNVAVLQAGYLGQSTQQLDVSGASDTAGSGVSQSVATTVGQLYALNFDYFTGADQYPSSFDVYVNNVLVFDDLATPSSTAVAATPTYFLGTGADVVTFLASTGNVAQIDNVSVAAVPEPASMAVLGLGLAALRRRRAKK